MGIKSLRQLLDEAAEAIELYRHPDLDEMRNRLDVVLSAAGEGRLGKDEIVYIRECLSSGGNYFEIETKWSIRGCEQRTEFKIPSSIVDSDDPLASAELWFYQRRLSEAKEEVEKCEKALEKARNRMASIQKEGARA